MAYNAVYDDAPISVFYYDLELGLPRIFNVPLAVTFQPDWCPWSIQDLGVFLDALATIPYTGSEITFDIVTGDVTVETSDVSLDGQSVTLYFTQQITDTPGSLVTPSVVTVNFVTDCNTLLLTPFTIADVTTQYDTPLVFTVSIPTDSWSNTYQQEDFCGDRAVTIRDVSTNTSPAAYSNHAELSTGIITVTLLAPDSSYIGTHSVELIFSLAAFPT